MSDTIHRHPTFRRLPRLHDLNDALALASGVEPLEQKSVSDYLDPITARLSYRFFRDCELAPFAAGAEEYRALNAWYLSEASLLAYAGATREAEPSGNDRAEALLMDRRLRPTLTRLFDAHRALSPGEPQGQVQVHCIARNVELLGLNSPLHCYVADNGEFGFVAFRGTEPTSLPNWLTDCEIGMVEPDGPSGNAALVHEGFLQASTALLADAAGTAGLHRYLLERRRQAPGLRLWFTGHSLGGALATLAAYRLDGIQGLYTFGSPRVGNSDFVNAFSRTGVKHYRVVHRHDIVPYMPMDLPFLDYEHVGELRHLISDTPQDVDAIAGSAPGSTPELHGAVTADHTADHVSLWRRLCESATHCDLGRFSDWLGHLTDHSLLFYSGALWNEFVRALQGDRS